MEWGTRRRGRACVCIGGGEAVSHRATAGTRRSRRRGGRIRGVGEVDALDEQAVDEHLQSVVDKAGRVDNLAMGSLDD